MKLLGNISGQQFYYCAIDDLIDRCSQVEKCAIIIDEGHLEKFLTNGISIIGVCVNQIIIIGGDVNTAFLRFKDENLLLLAANSFEEAARFAMLGSGFFHDVICIPKEDENTAREIINSIKI